MARRNFHFSPSEYHRYLMGRTEQQYKFNGGNFKDWQKKLKTKLKELMGFEIPNQKSPLNVRKIWKKNTEPGTIEKIVFTSEPFADVPAYVCVPCEFRKPRAWMICLQGHSTGMHNSIGVTFEDENLPKKIEGDRDFGIGCMKRGIGAICIEQRAFGERKELKQKQKSDHTCHDASMQALMLGKTLLAERVYDVERTIDYLETRSDVDRKMIGVMGNSGGGTVSVFSGALLTRIAFMMPSSYFCTFRDSVMSIYHCADNYIPGLLKYAEMSDILGLFAPKPVVVVSGKDDNIFPIQGTRKAFSELKKIYKAARADDKCRLVIGNGGHRFYADDAWPEMLKLIDAISQ